MQFAFFKNVRYLVVILTDCIQNRHLNLHMEAVWPPSPPPSRFRRPWLVVNLDLGESLKQKSHLSGSRPSDKTVCFDLILSRRTLARI